MFGYLVILFTLVPAIELWLLIKVGAHIGAGNTILIIISTGILGAYLARTQGLLVMQKMQAQMNQGQMPTEEIMDGVMVLIGGFLLLTPGFVTDTIGFLLLIPFTRVLIKIVVRQQIKQMMKDGTIVTNMGGSRRDSNKDGFIDVDGHSV